MFDLHIVTKLKSRLFYTVLYFYYLKFKSEKYLQQTKTCFMDKFEISNGKETNRG